MKVTTVTATIKYSQGTGKGAWKAVEIGAEAPVDSRETWQAAQSHLYADLGQQLKALWGQKAPEKLVEGSVDNVPSDPPAHYCHDHVVPFKQYSRGENVRNSHKPAEGKWCKEK